jgi:hypothetical protein
MERIPRFLALVTADTLLSCRQPGVIESGVFPFDSIVARRTAFPDLAMQVILGFLIPVARIAIVLQGGRKRVVHEVFDCTFRVEPFVIRMAFDAGVRGKPTVKKGLAAPFRQRLTGDVPDADICRPVATDALHRRAGKRLMTAQAVVFKFLMPCHEWAGVDQPAWKCDDQGSHDEGERNSVKYGSQQVTSSSGKTLRTRYG